MLDVFQVATLIPGAVGPGHDAAAVHVAAGPLALVNAAVSELVGPIAVHLILFEPPLIHGARARLVAPGPMLSPVQELPDVLGAIWIGLYAPADLFVFPPLALVGAAVCVDVPAVPMGFV